MLKDLEKLVDECDSDGGDGERLEIELRQAAQNLWRAQFLYRNDFGSKGSYDLILQHRAYFENLFGALGYRIVGGRPNDSRSTTTPKLRWMVRRFCRSMKIVRGGQGHPLHGYTTSSPVSVNAA
jgi:hypothetical protein